METVLFGIGLAALVLKMIEIAGQWPTLRQSLLGPVTRAYEPLSQICQELLQRLHRLPAPRRSGHFPRRLQAAVEHVFRKGSAQDLDDELKYLADVDATRQHNSYALFRVIIWAIPILGFLGTVIGITMALNGVRTDALEQSMNDVVTGLGVKFDTTALALAMAMILMFLHFFVDRWENSLLEEVDLRTQGELDGRFPQAAPAGEGAGAVLRQMTDAVVLAIERMVQRQTEVWQASMDAAATRWARIAQTAGSQVQESVVQGLAEGLRQHAEQLAAAEEAATAENRQRGKGPPGPRRERDGPGGASGRHDPASGGAGPGRRGQRRRDPLARRPEPQSRPWPGQSTSSRACWAWRRRSTCSIPG